MRNHFQHCQFLLEKKRKTSSQKRELIGNGQLESTSLEDFREEWRESNALNYLLLLRGKLQSKANSGTSQPSHGICERGAWQEEPGKLGLFGGSAPAGRRDRGGRALCSLAWSAKERGTDSSCLIVPHQRLIHHIIYIGFKEKFNRPRKLETWFTLLFILSQYNVFCWCSWQKPYLGFVSKGSEYHAYIPWISPKCKYFQKVLQQLLELQQLLQDTPLVYYELVMWLDPTEFRR